MFKLKTECSNDGWFHKTRLICPRCGTKDWFYSISPKRCEGCMLDFPDLNQIRRKSEYRTRWHLGKELC